MIDSLFHKVYDECCAIIRNGLITYNYPPYTEEELQHFITIEKTNIDIAINEIIKDYTEDDELENLEFILSIHYYNPIVDYLCDYVPKFKEIVEMEDEMEYEN